MMLSFNYHYLNVKKRSKKAFTIGFLRKINRKIQFFSHFKPVWIFQKKTIFLQQKTIIIMRLVE